MEKSLTREEEFILSLLKDSLTQNKRRKDADPGVNWNSFLILAEKHEIMSLLYDVMPVDMPKEILDVIRLRARQTVQKYYRMFFLTKYYVGKLRQAGIRCAVIKGVGASAAYPIPEYRKSGDLDIFVPDEKEFPKAEMVLVKSGLFRDPVQTEHHCVVFHHPEGIVIELHRALIEEVDDEEVNRKLRALNARFVENIEEIELLNNRFPVLKPPYQAFSLLLHMLHHYLHAGFGLRLLVDWVLFWKQRITKADRRTYLKLVKDLGLTGFSEFVTAVCMQELGLPEGTVHESVAKSKDAYFFFLKDIFESGEFGDEDDSRMVLLRGTSVFDYFREFHHQMKLHFPRASKVFLCWPGLWAATLVRFLKNNREVRNTTAIEVFKSSRERSAYTKELELFRR